MQRPRHVWKHRADGTRLFLPTSWRVSGLSLTGPGLQRGGRAAKVCGGTRGTVDMRRICADEREVETDVNFNFLLGFLSTFVGDLPRQGEAQARLERKNRPMAWNRIQAVLAKLSKEKKWNAFDSKQQHEVPCTCGILKTSYGFGPPDSLMSSIRGVLARPGRRQKQDSTAPWLATSATGVDAQRKQGGKCQLKRNNS